MKVRDFAVLKDLVDKEVQVSTCAIDLFRVLSKAKIKIGLYMYNGEVDY